MDGPTVAGGQQMLVFYPRHLDDARRVIAAVQGQQAVLLDTSHAADGEAQRLIDFACGGMEALEAQVHRISAEVFLFAPGQARVDASD
jgi:cell division inhibitor SepF